MAQEQASREVSLAVRNQDAAGVLAAKKNLMGNACLGCHVLDGTGGPIGPSFDGIGGRLDAAGIRKAILQPNADVSTGFEQVAGMMPTTFGSQLSGQQLEIIVAFLAERR
jgi:hypothetical protein